jgi:hypothetical protein
MNQIIDFDTNNNPYKVIENLRITYVKAKTDEKNTVCDKLRIQQVFNHERKLMPLETEIPLNDADSLLELIYGLIHLYIFEKKR